VSGCIDVIKGRLEDLESTYHQRVRRPMDARPSEERAMGDTKAGGRTPSRSSTSTPAYWMTDDPRDILRAAGVECAEVQAFMDAYGRHEWTNLTEADAAILALARIAAGLAKRLKLSRNGLNVATCAEVLAWVHGPGHHCHWTDYGERQKHRAEQAEATIERLHGRQCIQCQHIDFCEIVKCDVQPDNFYCNRWAERSTP